MIDFEDGPGMRISLRTDETETTSAFVANLPFSSKANRWGDEVYFEAPFHSRLEHDARAEMETGDVAFWPDGDAVALFFGPTPVSRGAKPQAYSPCNILGRLEGDASVLRRVKQGQALRVTLG